MLVCDSRHELRVAELDGKERRNVGGRARARAQSNQQPANQRQIQREHTHTYTQHLPTTQYNH